MGGDIEWTHVFYVSTMENKALGSGRRWLSQMYNVLSVQMAEVIECRPSVTGAL